MATVPIAIERYLYYKTADSGSLFTQEFCTLIGKGDVTGAAQLAAAATGECARILCETMEFRLHGISGRSCNCKIA